MSDTRAEFDALCAAKDDPFVPVTAGGLSLLVKPLSAAGFIAFQQPSIELNKKAGKATKGERVQAVTDSHLEVMRRCVYATDKTPLFEGRTDDELLSMPALLWNELLEACLTHSGIIETDVEELAKNSSETGGDDSPSV